MNLSDLQSELRLSGCRRNIFAFLALFVIIFLIYSNTFHASWHLDDFSNILENRSLHLTEMSWHGILKVLSSSPSSLKAPFIRPVSRFSLALNYALGGESVFGYHLVNISIHLVASLFLFLFLYCTLNLPTTKARYGPNSYAVALLATVLWAASPVQTQAVTYIVQRMASMAAMFYIMAMFFYLKGRTTEKKPLRAILYLLCILSGLLSLGSKENGILLPVSLLLYDLLVIQGISGTTLRKTMRIFLGFYVLTLILALVLLLVFTDAVTDVLGLYETRTFSLWQRILSEPRIVLFYITLLLYPLSSRLCIDHDIVISKSLLDPPATLGAILLLSLILAALLTLAKKRPLLAFCGLFFFLNHLIESTVLPLELVFEHRNYLPSMLFFVPVAVGLWNALLGLSYRRAMKGLMATLIVAVIAGSGHATYFRNLAWQSEESLWTDCVTKYPFSFRGHHNLGRAYQIRNEDQKAALEYHRALKGKTLHTRKEKGITYFNLGLIAHKQGRYGQALAFYRAALERDPCCPGLHNNLAGLILDREDGNPSEALDLLNSAIECRHDSEIPLALSNLGILLMKMGRPDRALSALQRAARMDPGNLLTLLRLGYVHKERGEWGTAALYLNRALSKEPKDGTGLLSLAEVYVRSGNAPRSAQVVSRFVETMPAQDFIPYAERTLAKRPLADISPDIRLLFPLLAEAYRAKGDLLERNRLYCLQQMKACGEDCK
ncbi:MAG: tetratricopeptide repeat protein [Deltaproteobacteria bacterium]|nr:tetratricopeptide repeat protein [Deltaproteobacteria bacterium]